MMKLGSFQIQITLMTSFGFQNKSNLHRNEHTSNNKRYPENNAWMLLMWQYFTLQIT